MVRSRSVVVVCLGVGSWLGLIGCAPKTPRSALAMRENMLEFRQRSTRRFMTDNEETILSACAGVLQDLGFTVEKSETDLGFILGTKDRTAVEGGQVAGKIFVAILLQADVPIDKNQTFRVSIVSRPSAGETAVRVTFQRVVWNDRNEISKLEPIEEPAVYQEFFDRLAKSVFLEAHAL